jgi:hypothetical protein
MIRINRTSMRFVIGTALVAVLAGSSALATRDKNVFVGEQLSQYDAVIVAGPGSVSVVEISNPPDGRPFVTVAQVTIQEVIKGSGLVAGGDVTIAFDRPSALAGYALLMGSTMIESSAVWLLERADSQFPAAYLARCITEPDTPANLGPYVDLFRAAAASESGRSNVHLDLQIPLSSAPHGQPLPASVRVFTNPGESGVLPAPVPWADRVKIFVEPDADPAVPVDLTWDDVPVNVAVLSAIGQGGDTIPDGIGPGSQYVADVTLFPTDMKLIGPQAFRCYARLLDDNGRTLLQSPPVFLTITP